MAGYLLCGVLIVLMLVAGSLYLTRGSSSAASPSARGTVTALPTADACGPAHNGTCAGQSPIGLSAATAPSASRTVRATRRAVHPAPSPSPSARQAATRTPASATAAASGQPKAPASPPATLAGPVLALIDAARSAAGLPALTITAGLETSASAHNSLMAAGCGLSHQCPGEPDLGARETAAGVRWTAAGENIGEGGPVAGTTAAIAQMAVTLTQDMLNEQPPNDGHRKNILSTSFTHIGIAVYRDSSGTVWLTQDFSD